jgi:hypothetical protein
MPTGPKGQKRPADVIGNAVRVMRIATGDEVDECDVDDGKDPAAKALGAKGGRKRAEVICARRWTRLRRNPARAAPTKST